MKTPSATLHAVLIDKCARQFSYRKTTFTCELKADYFRLFFLLFYVSRRT